MRNKAQSTLEYTVLIIVVAAALFTMQVYFKRGIQGRIRSNADDLSGASAYSPGATNSISKVTKTIEENATSYTKKENNILGDINEINISEANTTINQTTERNETVLPFNAEPQR